MKKDRCNNKKWMKSKEKGLRFFLLIVLIIVCGGYAEKRKNGYPETLEIDNSMENQHNGADAQMEQDDSVYKDKPEEMPQLYAKAAVLADGKNGRILWQKAGKEVLPMASTTKIMTCIAALEFGKNRELNKEWCEVSSYAVSQPKVKANLRKGEKYLMSDLLYSMMLESHNDTAVVVAEQIGKWIAETENRNKTYDSKAYVKLFADWMDKKAKKLGCPNTNFVTPNGLDAKDERGDHATTAEELAKIAAYAMKNNDFCKIITTQEYQFADAENKHRIHVYNKDAYLTMEEGACGIKTGFTNKAGYCFVGARKKEDDLLISVVLASGWPPEKSKKWSDTRKLMAYGTENYQAKKIQYLPVEQYIQVKNGMEEYCMVCADQMAEEEMLMAPWEKFHAIQYKMASVEAPIQKGEIVGYQIYFIGDQFWKYNKIYANEAVKSRTYLFCIKRMITKFLI